MKCQCIHFVFCIAGAEVCVVSAHFSTIFVLADTDVFRNSLQKLIPPAGAGLRPVSCFVKANFSWRANHKLHSEFSGLRQQVTF